jgi:uncharacterized damage-inducible protein DinB
MPESNLALAIDQIRFARGYTLQLIADIDPAEWFHMPGGGVTHVAWQLGHLAMAEYRLALERTRGSLPEDDALIGEPFLKAFGRASAPSPDARQYPSPAEIRAVLDRVHEQTLRELPGLSEAALAEPPTKPHKLAATKLASILWCGQHEMLHAGQIGLLRRTLGRPPLW